MKPNTSRKKTGRPSAFVRIKPSQFQACIEAGMDDAQMAAALGVTDRTINRWKLKHNKFCQSIKAMKAEHDVRVERALLERAIGYSHKAEKILLGHGGEVVRAEYTEHYPPDVKACEIWLVNRQPDKWKRIKHVELSGNGPNGEVLHAHRVDAVRELIAEASAGQRGVKGHGAVGE